jgi:hypothetical protein
LDKVVIMADLRLRISIVEKNDRGQEVELVRKTIQFNPQVIMVQARLLRRRETFDICFVQWDDYT